MTCNEAMDRELAYGDPDARREVTRREYEEAQDHIVECPRCQERNEQRVRMSEFGWDGTPKQRAAISRERVERLLGYLPAAARNRVLASYARMSDEAKYAFMRRTLDELPVLDGALDDEQVADLAAIADDVAAADALNRAGTLAMLLPTRALSDPS